MPNVSSFLARKFPAIAAFALLLGAGTPAFAAAPPSSPAPALDPAFCRALVKHVPDADVAYRPGVDVHGKPVVPADMDNGPQIALPEEITLPITADMFGYLNLDPTSFPFNTMKRNDIYVGTLTVRGDKLFWNGQPLSDAQQDNLAVLCLKPTKQP